MEELMASVIEEFTNRLGGKPPDCPLCGSINWKWGAALFKNSDSFLVVLRCTRCTNSHLIDIAKLGIPIPESVDIEMGDSTLV